MKIQQVSSGAWTQNSIRIRTFFLAMYWDKVIAKCWRCRCSVESAKLMRSCHFHSRMPKMKEMKTDRRRTEKFSHSKRKRKMNGKIKGQDKKTTVSWTSLLKSHTLHVSTFFLLIRFCGSSHLDIVDLIKKKKRLSSESSHSDTQYTVYYITHCVLYTVMINNPPIGHHPALFWVCLLIACHLRESFLTTVASALAVHQESHVASEKAFCLTIVKSKWNWTELNSLIVFEMMMPSNQDDVQNIKAICFILCQSPLCHQNSSDSMRHGLHRISENVLEPRH